MIKINVELYNEIKKYIDNKYYDAHKSIKTILYDDSDKINEIKEIEFNKELEIPAFIIKRRRNLDKKINRQLESSFSEELMNIIEDRNLKPADVYRKASIDRKLFSKIKNNIDYKPSKITAIAFALALELELDEAISFIGKAGYTLTHSSKFDIIIEYCIENKIYNIMEVNDILFSFEEEVIGTNI